MHQKLVLVVFVTLMAVSPTILFLVPDAASASMDVSKPTVVTIDGFRLIELGVNSQAIIQIDFQNTDDQNQEYVMIVEVRDSDGISVYLQFQKGQLAPKSAGQLGVSWIAEQTGSFQIRAFVLSDFENPVVLSPVSSTFVRVGKVSELDSTATVDEEDLPPESSTNPVKEPTLNDLKKYALDKINEDRRKFDLPLVQLSDNPAAQLHAEDVLKTRTISHWMSNGEKPYMTYSRYGGEGGIAQNVAMTGDYYYYKDCSSGEYTCEPIEPYKAIDIHQYGLVYDDEECCDNGHRYNILDKYHTHASIGIAYDDYAFVLVQNFENIYIEYDEPIEGTDGYVEMSGEILSGKLYGIEVYYDETPTVDVYNEFRDQDWYSYGEFLAIVIEPARVGYYYEQPDDYTLIEARNWDVEGQSFDIAFQLRSVMKEDGVYTVVVLLEDENGDIFEATSHSFFE